MEITPAPVRRWVDKRFDQTVIDKEDEAAYDLVRASVNLMVASMLIALGTSLKLPLSTTYVTFMVAMSTSLADRAWSRESAVFRVTGMLSVIGGWFLTAGIAFTCAFLLATLMHFGGLIVAAFLIVAGLTALIHSNMAFKKKSEDNAPDKEFAAIINCKDSAQTWNLFSNYVTGHEVQFLNGMSDNYLKVTEGLLTEDVRMLRKSNSELRQVKEPLKKLRKRETLLMRRVDPETGMVKSAWFHMIFNNMEQVYYSLRRICEPAYEHVDNNFSPIPDKNANEFREARNALMDIIRNITSCCIDEKYENLRADEENLYVAQKKFSDMRKALVADIQDKDTNITVAYLYLNLIQESEQLTIVLRHLSRASRKFHLG